MAQTKKQRFKKQKRVEKVPAPKPPVTKVRKVDESPTSGKKKIVIGISAVVALAGVAGTILLLSNPFASPEAAKPNPVETKSAAVQQDEMTAGLVRSSLIRDYRMRVDQTFADQVFQSCDSGEAVAGTGINRGTETPIAVTCLGTKLKVVNSTTNVEIPPGG